MQRRKTSLTALFTVFLMLVPGLVEAKGTWSWQSDFQDTQPQFQPDPEHDPDSFQDPGPDGVASCDDLEGFQWWTDPGLRLRCALGLE